LFLIALKFYTLLLEKYPIIKPIPHKITGRGLSIAKTGRIKLNEGHLYPK